MISIKDEDAILAGLDSQNLDRNEITNGKATNNKKIKKRNRKGKI